jgi:hypothetical protein
MHRFEKRPRFVNTTGENQPAQYARRRSVANRHLHDGDNIGTTSGPIFMEATADNDRRTRPINERRMATAFSAE